MPSSEHRATSGVAHFESKVLELPATPAFPKTPELKKEEHKETQKPKSRYRAIKDIGEPTRVQELGHDPSHQKR